MKLHVLGLATLLTLTSAAEAQSWRRPGTGHQDRREDRRDDRRHDRRDDRYGHDRRDDRYGHDRRDDRYENDRRDDRYGHADRYDRGNNLCRLDYAGRTQSTQEWALSACQQRVNEAVVQHCERNPNSTLRVTYRWNGQGDTATFPCRGWGPPGGGPTCTLRYKGRVQTTKEVAMGACQQRVNEAVVAYCQRNPGDRVQIDYRWNGAGAVAPFICNQNGSVSNGR